MNSSPNFSFLLGAYKKELSSRSIYTTIKCGAEYSNRYNDGQVTTVGSFRQVSCASEDCDTALHEAIHIINADNKLLMCDELDRNYFHLTSRDIAILATSIVKCGHSYKHLAVKLMASFTNMFRQDTALYNTLDELLAQCTIGQEFWKQHLMLGLEQVLIKILGYELVKFMILEVRGEEYYPTWNSIEGRFE